MNLKTNPIYTRIRSSRKLRLLLLLLGVLLFVILFFIPAIRKSWSCLSTELNVSYCVDNPLYWAVGRGILNGLTPYIDLFENKPPGIFWLSALSMKFTGGVYAMNIFSFLCLLITMLTPAIAATILCFKRNCGKVVTAVAILCSLLFGMMMMVYAQTRSGYIQVEAMGIVFVDFYLLLIYDTDASKLKFYSPKVILSGLMLACAGLLKEPFVLVAVGASFLFVDNWRSLLYKNVLPLLYGGALGVGAMAATGVLKPYITIYLKYMFASRVDSSSSPFVRMWNILNIINEMGSFSMVFLCVITLLFIAVFFYFFQDFRELPSAGRKGRLLWVWRFIGLFAGLMCSSFSVAVGGRYFYHHFVFALPFYLSLFLLVLRGSAVEPKLLPQKDADNDKTAGFGVKQCRIVLAGILLALSVNFRFIPYFSFDQSITKNFQIMTEQAEYVDALLDEKGIDRYQFLGFNDGGVFFYGLTKHSPLGPVFVQDPANFTGDYDWFAENLFKQLDEAQIVFVWDLKVGDLSDEVMQILNTDFVRDDAHSANRYGLPIPGLPTDFKYVTYIRKTTQTQG